MSAALVAGLVSWLMCVLGLMQQKSLWLFLSAIVYTVQGLFNIPSLSLYCDLAVCLSLLMAYDHQSYSMYVVCVCVRVCVCVCVGGGGCHRRTVCHNKELHVYQMCINDLQMVV